MSMEKNVVAGQWCPAATRMSKANPGHLFSKQAPLIWKDVCHCFVEQPCR